MPPTSAYFKGTKHIIKCCLLWAIFQCWCLSALADNSPYQVEITINETDNAQTSDAEDIAPIKDLLEKHLQIIEWRENARMTASEWQRLFTLAPENIKTLLTTEGYFNPIITSHLEQQSNISTAKFNVTLGKPATISKVDIQFTGAINQAAQDITPSMAKLREQWLLPTQEVFRQDYWAQAKRRLLTNLLVERYPNASITNSLAEVNVEENTVALKVEIDSGDAVRFGELNIEGLERYSQNIVNNLNPIKPDSIYTQTDLLTLQNRLQESGYFRNVEVTADTKSANESNHFQAPIKIVVNENKSIKVGVGAGYSTNTGARVQLTYDDLDIMNRGWRLNSSLKLEEKAQAIVGQILFPITKKGYLDSVNASLNRSTIEGQTLTSSQVGIKRAWGPRKREQYIGANYLVEQQEIDGGDTTTKKVATIGYGITLRHTDNDLAPTRGYLLNAEFAYAPFDALSSGQFLHSRIKTQIYYPITNSTQFIARAEFGMVNGKNSAPEAFLFRAGGDQSVRGYAFQSLGVAEAGAVVGGKYLATGSVEIVQWLTKQWGMAAFVDAGNAANQWKDLKPAIGYGLGVRWKSPLGPIGADIAYGQDVQKYRLHFNIGVAF
ncbi:MAG: autotransporter assembly complex family protein [Methylophilaceae bacterium]